MDKAEQLLSFADTLLEGKTGTDLSRLQRLILLTTLQGVKTSYQDIAAAHNYSPRYLRQDIAPKLWQRLSQVLACKVSKHNVRVVLEREMECQGTDVSSSPEIPRQSLQGAIAPAHCSATATLFSSTTEPERGNILLVDDHPENLMLLSHLLEEEGHNVRQAISGAIALQATEFSAPDLVLLDINMPEMDGYAVCQHLRENPATQDIPVIFISALDESWDKMKAFTAGGNDYITKPFKTIEVLARVQTQLKVQRLQEMLKATEHQLQTALQEIDALRDRHENNVPVQGSGQVDG